jgi:hypothetical protein
MHKNEPQNLCILTKDESHLSKAKRPPEDRASAAINLRFDFPFRF